MPKFQPPVQRLLVAGAFVVATATAPGLAAFSASAPPTAPPVAQVLCPGGEEPDPFTNNCVPYNVPTSPRTFTGIPGNPNVPAVDLPGSGYVPCAVGANCIGIAQVPGNVAGSQARSRVGGTPTITGEVGP